MMSRQVDWDHENVIEEAFAAAERTTVSAAARTYGLRRSTLQSRIDGAVNIHIAKEETQRLSYGEERHLVDWILNEEEASRTHATTKEALEAHIDCVDRLIKAVMLVRAASSTPTKPGPGKVRLQLEGSLGAS